MSTNTVNLGERLRDLRIQNGLTQAEVADRMALSQTMISNWENNRFEPDERQLESLERILGPLVSPKQQLHSASVEGSTPFGSWLTETRVVSGLSVAELAEAAGVSVPTVYNIESGRIENPQKQTVRRLERVLKQKVPEEAAAKTEEQATIEGVGELVGFNPHIIDEVPAVPGIYVFYDVSDRPIYVGESADIKRRIRGHREAFGSRSRSSKRLPTSRSRIRTFAERSRRC